MLFSNTSEIKNNRSLLNQIQSNPIFLKLKIAPILLIDRSYVFEKTDRSY